MDLYERIQSYRPVNEQEQRDKELILNCMGRFSDVFSRSNTLCHMTASAWTVNPSRTKVLLAYHNIYNSWTWLGGHADGETDLAKVALREVTEESGVTNVKLVSEEIISLEVLNVDGHIKKGRYVSSHLHLNVTYLIEADDNSPLIVRPEENKAVGWFTPEGVIDASSEEWFKINIFPKLNARIR